MDEGRHLTQGSVLVRNQKFQDRVVAETRAFLAAHGMDIFAYSCSDRLPFFVFEIAALLTSRSRRPNSLRMRSAAPAIEG